MPLEKATATDQARAHGYCADMLWHNEEMEQPNLTYFEAYDARGRQDGDMGVSVRKGKSKAIANSSLLDELALYDMDQYPGETNNLASAYPDKIQEFRNNIRDSRTHSEEWPLDKEVWEAFLAR